MTLSKHQEYTSEPHILFSSLPPLADEVDVFIIVPLEKQPPLDRSLPSPLRSKGTRPQNVPYYDGGGWGIGTKDVKGIGTVPPPTSSTLRRKSKGLEVDPSRRKSRVGGPSDWARKVRVPSSSSSPVPCPCPSHLDGLDRKHTSELWDLVGGRQLPTFTETLEERPGHLPSLEEMRTGRSGVGVGVARDVSGLLPFPPRLIIPSLVLKSLFV